MSFHSKRLLACLALGAACQMWTVHAMGQSSETLRRLSAEALFDQGLRLMDAHDYPRACPKLEESQRLDPGIGTLLYLADCYRSLGKTASSWMTFREAAFEAKRSGESERERIALKYADELRSLLTLLELQLEDTVLDQVMLSLDGQPISGELIGVPFPVDPGVHSLSCEAPGKRPWTTSLDLAPIAGTTLITVPQLRSEPVSHPPQLVRQPLATVSDRNWKALGWLLTGTGALALGGAGVLYAANSDQWMGPALLGTAGAFGAGIGVFLVTRPVPLATGHTRKPTALRSICFAYSNSF